MAFTPADTRGGCLRPPLPLILLLLLMLLLLLLLLALLLPVHRRCASATPQHSGRVSDWAARRGHADSNAPVRRVATADPESTHGHVATRAPHSHSRDRTAAIAAILVNDAQCGAPTVAVVHHHLSHVAPSILSTTRHDGVGRP